MGGNSFICWTKEAPAEMPASQMRSRRSNVAGQKALCRWVSRLYPRIGVQTSDARAAGNVFGLTGNISYPLMM